jgi:hypothetical protein
MKILKDVGFADKIYSDEINVVKCNIASKPR